MSLLLTDRPDGPCAYDGRPAVKRLQGGAARRALRSACPRCAAGRYPSDVEVVRPINDPPAHRQPQPTRLTRLTRNQLHETERTQQVPGRESSLGTHARRLMSSA